MGVGGNNRSSYFLSRHCVRTWIKDRVCAVTSVIYILRLQVATKTNIAAFFLCGSGESLVNLRTLPPPTTNIAWSNLSPDSSESICISRMKASMCPCELGGKNLSLVEWEQSWFPEFGGHHIIFHFFIKLLCTALGTTRIFPSWVTKRMIMTRIFGKDTQGGRERLFNTVPPCWFLLRCFTLNRPKASYEQDIQQNRKGRGGIETHAVIYFLCLSINWAFIPQNYSLNGQVDWRKLENIGQAKEKSKSSITVLCRFTLDKYFFLNTSLYKYTDSKHISPKSSHMTHARCFSLNIIV